MKYDFDQTVNRYGTQSLKWSEPGILPLWVADMDFLCPKPILEALEERIRTGIFGYTFLEKPFTAVLQNWFSSRYGWQVQEEDLFYSPGVMASIGYLIRTLTREGQGILIQPPVYPYFRTIIQANGRKVMDNPLICEEGKYRMDFRGLEEQASKPGTTMMLLCSPHNPVGRVWTREELRKTVEICRQYGVTLISDEIHADILRSGRSFLPADLVHPWEGIITCGAPSKTFNIPGLMCSHVIIRNPEWKKKWEREAYDASGQLLPNPCGYSAALAAYSHCADWLEQLKIYLDRNLAYIGEVFQKHNAPIRYHIPEGTYLAWLDFNEFGLSDQELEDRIWGKARVWLSRGTSFYHTALGYRRLNAACPRPILEEALERILMALA